MGLAGFVLDLVQDVGVVPGAVGAGSLAIGALLWNSRDARHFVASRAL